MTTTRTDRVAQYTAELAEMTTQYGPHVAYGWAIGSIRNLASLAISRDSDAERLAGIRDVLAALDAHARAQQD